MKVGKLLFFSSNITRRFDGIFIFFAFRFFIRGALFFLFFLFLGSRMAVAVASFDNSYKFFNSQESNDSTQNPKTDS